MKTKDSKSNMLTSRDVSIPGSEMYDTLENLGIEEEEDNFYSIGDNGHGDQEEETEENIALNYHWYIMTLKGGQSRKPA
jgi:hypothetical protein